MYICVCKAVSDKEVRQLIQAGARTAAELERQCGAGGDCGSCISDLENLLDAHQQASAQPAGCARRQRKATLDLALAA